MPTAVIDIGTNTLLLLVIDDQMRPLADLCRFGRLGKGLDATCRLDPTSIARSLEICREYRAVLDGHGVQIPAVVGTQALREATNAADFVRPAQQILGAPIEVISGPREAELAFLSVSHTFPELAGSPYLVVDVGGGSTELIATDGTRVTSAVSIPIGAVRLTERHLHSDPPSPAELAALHADIDTHLSALAPTALPTGIPLVGTAGTATTFASVALALPTYSSEAVTGIRISYDEVADVATRITRATVAQRRAMPGMEPARADVIAGGVAIYTRLMERIASPLLITCDRGVRWGLAFERA